MAGSLQTIPAPPDAPDQGGQHPLAVDLASNDLEIINEKGFSTSASTWYLRRFGFEAKTYYWDKNFVCLMKLPLKPGKGSPFPAALAQSKTLGVDFESGHLEIRRPNNITRSVVHSGAATLQQGADVPILTPIMKPMPGGVGGIAGAMQAQSTPVLGNVVGGPGAGEASEDPDKLSYWLSIDLASKNGAVAPAAKP